MKRERVGSPSRGLSLLQSELLEDCLPQPFANFVATVPRQGGLLALEVEFRMASALFENHSPGAPVFKSESVGMWPIAVCGSMTSLLGHQSGAFDIQCINNDAEIASYDRPAGKALEIIWIPQAHPQSPRTRGKFQMQGQPAHEGNGDGRKRR